MSDGNPSCCGLNCGSLRWGLLLAIPLGLVVLAKLPSLEIIREADVTLQSEPAGASAFINGRLAGATPLTVKHVPLGQYALRLEKEGFTPVVRTLALKKEGLTLREKLPQLPTSVIDVSVKPDGAEVFLDGELQGHTPLNLADVPVGAHDLLIRKTNYNPYSKQIVLEAGEPLVFKDFELDDRVMQMLNSNIAKEETRVGHYMDLGHYLFVNDHLDTAATAYAKALEVSATKLTFGKETLPEEQRLLERLRNEDRSRLASQIGLKETWPRKNLTEFIKTVETRRKELCEQHIKEWWWINEQSSHYISAGKGAEGEALLQKFIEVNKNEKDAPIDSAQMALLGARIKLHKLAATQESVGIVTAAYPTRVDLFRQAGDAAFAEQAKFPPNERPEVLNLAEKLYRLAVEQSKVQKNIDQQAVCEFQVGLVLAERGKMDEAIAVYREAINNTKDEATKEQRTQKLVESYRTKHDYGEARNLLTELSKSKREPVASKAKQDLKELASVEAAQQK